MLQSIFVDRRGDCYERVWLPRMLLITETLTCENVIFLFLIDFKNWKIGLLAVASDESTRDARHFRKCIDTGLSAPLFTRILSISVMFVSNPILVPVVRELHQEWLYIPAPLPCRRMPHLIISKLLNNKGLRSQLHVYKKSIQIFPKTVLIKWSQHHQRMKNAENS